jgi:hypothetical protein
MPARSNYYSPDAIDLNTTISAIANDFGCICNLTLHFRDDKVVVVAICVGLGNKEADGPLVQSRVSRPLKPAPDLAVMFYSAALDCWHQLDRGVLAVANVKPVFGWNGRPHQPKPRKRS